MKVFLSAVAGLIWLTATQTCPAQGLSFSDAVERAGRDAPALAAHAEQREAATQSAIAAGALPDPQLLLGIDNLPLQGADAYSLTRDGMTMRRIGLMQEFTSTRLRAARRAAAQGRIAMTVAETRVTRAGTMRQAAMAWLARDTAERQLALLDALRTENRLLDATVRGRRAAGQGMAAETVAARREAAQIDERQDLLQSQREQSIAMLEQWIGVQAAALPLSGEAPDWAIDREVLLHGLQHHPEFSLLDARQSVLDAEVSAAVAERHPGWSVEVAYQKRAAMYGDMLSLQVRVPLTFWSGSRQDPLIAARRAERRALESEREAERREHTQTLDVEIADYHRLRRAVDRQRSLLLPLAEEELQLVLADWRGNKATALDVVAARSRRIDAALQLIALQGEQRQTAASLHYRYADSLGVLP
jgi:outer membrane protein TolC